MKAYIESLEQLTRSQLILLLARRNLVRLAGAAGVAVALAAGPVVFALTSSTPAVRHITVALVQQGVQPSRASRVNASLRLSEGLGAARPDLIVWGESSVGYDIERADTGLLGRIRAVAARTGAEILVNQDSTLPGGGKSKVALLINPRGVGPTKDKNGKKFTNGFAGVVDVPKGPAGASMLVSDATCSLAAAT